MKLPKIQYKDEQSKIYVGLVEPQNSTLCPQSTGHSFFLIGASGQLSSPPLQYTKPNSSSLCKIPNPISTLYCCHGNNPIQISKAWTLSNHVLANLAQIFPLVSLQPLVQILVVIFLVLKNFFFSSLDHLTYILLFKNNFFFDQMISNLDTLQNICSFQSFISSSKQGLVKFSYSRY